MLKRSLLLFITLCGTLSTLFAEIPHDYYPASIEGKNRASLKLELHKLIANHEIIAYGAHDYDGACTWTVFKQSDCRPDGTVWDMYSNNVWEFTSSSTSGMHIEHSVPKSWWGEDGSGSSGYCFNYDASYDMHHLVPADGTTNLRKSNYPLGIVKGNDSKYNGVSKIGSATVNDETITVFEPADEYKGDFARMYLYVVTCYQDYTWLSRGTTMFASNAYPTLNDYGMSLLLQWHRQDSVSQKEIDRNNAVYQFQKNRNPYIDYPQLVEYIWGEKTDEDFFLSKIDAVKTPDLKILNGKGSLTIVADEATQVTIYSILGTVVTKTIVEAGNTTLHLPAGIYMANGIKGVVF